jgi:TATA-box binding protein (TBP) (component of TFIID and TFIIIB)
MKSNTDDEFYEYEEESHHIPLEPVLCKRIIVDETEVYDELESEKIQKFKDYVGDELLYHLIPKDINISTMTATCKINDFKFNCENIAKYIDLSYDDIVDIVCATEEGRKRNDADNKDIVYRTLPSKKHNKREKKQKNVFYNQVSMHLNIKTKISDSVHVKLFLNGSVHITGCRTADDIVETMVVILKKLKKNKAIIDRTTKQIVEKPFVSDKKYLDISYISNLKINMINTNFSMPFKINLTELYALMLKKGIECRNDKISHACVNVKYDHAEKKISIFVFEKGSIVITGAKNGDHIKTAFEFINKFLYANYLLIVKKDLNLRENVNDN